MNAASLEKLEVSLGHTFKSKNLLRDALTHSSSSGETNYERLEFLGDRVLGLVMAQILYQKFTGETEGDLAKRLAALVQGSLLAEIAGQVNLGNYIILSDAERGSGGSQKENILADALEAVIGALFLDAGLEACMAFIKDRWDDHFDKMKLPPQHPKTSLQEWAQGAGLPLPLYEIIGQHGPDHAPVFEIKLFVKGYEEIVAEGRTRQEAEKKAALLFLQQHAGDR